MAARHGGPVLVVTVEEIARRLGLRQPLPEADRWQIEQAIADAQSDLQAYLGRLVYPATYTQQHVLRGGGRFHGLEHEPVISITSSAPEADDYGHPTGRWTVVYVAGLDGANDPELEPIRRFIRTHALYSSGVQKVFRRLDPDGGRRATDLTVEGQSVGYADEFPADPRASELGLPGGLPSLSSCEAWRVAGRWVHQAPTRSLGSWPYDGLDPFHSPTLWW